MKPLLFSIEINAPKARVHQLMLADKTYRVVDIGFCGRFVFPRLMGARYANVIYQL